MNIEELDLRKAIFRANVLKRTFSRKITYFRPKMLQKSQPDRPLKNLSKKIGKKNKISQNFSIFTKKKNRNKNKI